MKKLYSTEISCCFDGKVNLDFSSFKHSLIIGGSVFEKRLSFHGAGNSGDR